MLIGFVNQQAPDVPSTQQLAYTVEVGKRFLVSCGKEQAVVAIAKVAPQWVDLENEDRRGNPMDPRHIISVRHGAFRATIKRELPALTLEQQKDRGYL